MKENNIIEAMRERLINVLAPTHLEIIDESAKHIGHQPMPVGGHFKLIIASEKFNGKSLIDKHKLIYQALDDLMKMKIHALSIKIV